ncbi:MAG: DUF4783 domain-containing protein [Prevotellaceae bacterium]|jgi:hypothetical protein|nr:DUF4783 domain-containing protein [Prevotellaceae bacterium]
MNAFFWLFLFFPFIATAETPQTSQTPCEKLFEPIIQALRNNDAEAFSDRFAKVIEFDMFDEVKIYSKEQASQIANNFFLRMSVKRITLKHCSGKEYLKYAVTEITNAEDLLYRATIFVRIENDGAAVIQEVRLEKEE